MLKLLYFLLVSSCVCYQVDYDRFLPSEQVAGSIPRVNDDVTVTSFKSISVDPATFSGTSAEEINQSSPEFAKLTDVQNTIETLSTTVWGQLNGYSVTSAILLIVSGLALLFYGHSMIRTMLFIVGFYLGSLASIVLLDALQTRGVSLGSDPNLVFFLASLGIGLVFGGLMMCAIKFGIAIMGAFLGVSLANLALQIPALSNLVSSSTRLIIIGVSAIVFLILAIFLETAILILSTATVGSYALFIGIDFFAHTGFAQTTYQFLTKSNDPVTLSTNGLIMLCGCVGVGILGVLVQSRHVQKRHNGYQTTPAKPMTQV